MDIYSNHRIPFSIGVWARGHKFHPTAVQITRDLKSIAKIEEEYRDLERRKEQAEQALRGTLALAEEHLKESGSGY